MSSRCSKQARNTAFYHLQIFLKEDVFDFFDKGKSERRTKEKLPDFLPFLDSQLASKANLIKCN